MLVCGFSFTQRFHFPRFVSVFPGGTRLVTKDHKQREKKRKKVGWQSYQLKGCGRRVLTGILLGKRHSKPENKNDHNLILRVSQCLHITTGKFSSLVVDRSQKYVSQLYVILCWVGEPSPLGAFSKWKYTCPVQSCYGSTLLIIAFAFGQGLIMRRVLKDIRTNAEPTWTW